MVKKIFLLILFLINMLTVFSQVVSVKAVTDKQKILLGEPLQLTLEINVFGKNDSHQFPLDSIPHFEFIKKDSTEKIQQNDTTLIKRYFYLTSFDSGRWVIPPITIAPNVQTKAILVNVVFTEGFDSSKPYHDIKDIKALPFQINRNIEKSWYLIALGFIIITILLYWLTSPDIKKPRKSKSNEGAYEKALRLLEELREYNPDEKVFYAGLVDIFRQYILECAGIDSLQQTSGDLIEKLKPLFNEEIKYKNLSNVLFLCDLVKFAKYDPEDSEAKSAHEVIVESIKLVQNKINKKPHETN